MNTINTTLVCGNGIDLALGMETSYKTFFVELNVRGGFFDQHLSNPLTDYIQNVGKKENWFDFESIIKEFATQSTLGIALRRGEECLSLLENSKKLKKNAFKQLGEYEDLVDYIPSLGGIIDFAKNHKYYEFRGEQVYKMYDVAVHEINSFILSKSVLIRNGFDDLKRALVEFVHSMSHLAFESSCAYKILGAILGLPKQKGDTLVDAFSKRLKNKKDLPHPKNQIVSFNYLNELDILGRYLQFDEKITQRLGLEDYLDTPFFMSIHGHLDFSNINNFDANIIFGADDDSDIPNCLYFLKKTSWQEENKKRQFNYILHHSKRIVIYGHSIHGIDYDYYRNFLSEPRDDKEIYIIVNKQETVDAIRYGLNKMGCKAFIKYLIVDGFATKEYKKLCEDIIRDTVDKNDQETY